MDVTLNPVQCFLCLPQQRTHKSGFCAVWRKTTTNSRCSSRTQGYPLCPIIQRSRFRFASVIRTGCTAARPTPIVPGFLCRSQHSCSPYSVSTSQPTPTTTENSGFLCVFYFLLSSKVNSCRFQYRRVQNQCRQTWSIILFRIKAVFALMFTCKEKGFEFFAWEEYINQVCLVHFMFLYFLPTSLRRSQGSQTWIYSKYLI